MSIDATDMPAASPEEPLVTGPKKQRRRAGKAKPGISMLATGEPMIWLTGGSLAFCVVMILGLLGVVIYQGMKTFWPMPVVQVELKDGSLVLGEITRHENYSLTMSLADEIDSEEIQSAAYAELKKAEESKDDTVDVRRRQFRTGNYKLSNAHYDWVSDFAVDEGAETKPEWAVVVERTEWGRFYGFPNEFAVRVVREPTEEEKELKSVAIDHFSYYRMGEGFNRLYSELEGASLCNLAICNPIYGSILGDVVAGKLTASQRSQLENDQRQAVDEALAPLRIEYEKVRDENIEKFVSGVKDEFSGDDLRFDAILEGATDAVLLADVEDGQNIVELHAVWQGEEITWQKFNDFHDEVRAKARESKRLKKHDLGVLTDKRNQYSLRMRRKEIDHDIFLIPAAKAIESFRNEQTPLNAEREMTTNTVSSIVSEHSADSPLGIAGSAIGRWWIGQIDAQMATSVAGLKELEAELAQQPEDAQQSVEDYLQATADLDAKSAEIQSRIDEIKEHNESYELRMVTAQGQDRTIALADVIRAYPANQLSTWDKLGVYFDRWGEFLTEEPIESGSAGGVFPAIWGTVVMTIIMSLAVVPFGVLAALYLREYAKAGLVVSAVRIAINNLAGVPSIVFGVFGLGFFCYLIGAYVDGGPGNAGIPQMPPARWYATAFALAVIAVGAFLCGAFSFSARAKEASRFKHALKYLSFALWITSTVLLVVLVFGTPFFSGLYETSLPNPTFGKGGLLWASLTLALLTLPVVIVATEEALSAVPNSLREGSYACGGSKWQTIKRIVLPHAMPGIMTGMILAMARGAGEVAPLMLVGVVKEATDLPLDSIFPYFHGNRSFLHLGFYIYERGFQSQDSEAAKPIVFSTTLLLISIVFLLNLFAVFLRSRLQKHFQGSQF